MVRVDEDRPNAKRLRGEVMYSIDCLQTSKNNKLSVRVWVCQYVVNQIDKLKTLEL